jgi:hypothetical protein
LLEVTDHALHDLLLFLSDRNLPLPEVGLELCDEKDEVVATGELCWPERKIALLRGDEQGFAEAFSAQGWRTASLDDMVRESFQCIALRTRPALRFRDKGKEKGADDQLWGEE